MNNEIKDKTYIHYLQNIITNLPKTEEDNKKQKMYDIFIAVMVIVPLFVGPILLALNYIVLGICVLVGCYGIVAIVGISKRKNIIKRFYKIKNAHTRFNLINVVNEDIIEELYKNSALTFISEPSNELLDFIYNWLNNENVLKSASENLNLYVFNGQMLKTVFNYSRYPDNTNFLSIFLKDLNLNETNKNSFSRNHLSVGSRWLDDIVDNDKK